MPNDPVQKAVDDSKRVLANATNFTQNVEGNPTSMFAPKAEPKHITGVPSYQQAHAARKAGGLSGLVEQAGSEKAIENRAPLKELNQQ